MKKYIAVVTFDRGAAGPWCSRIMSTFANSAEEARAEIARELARPGRYEYLNAWREHGEEMLEEEVE